jgi:hypothetical protein
MDSEMFCLFLFQSSKEIFERPIKIVWMVSQQIFLTSVSPFSKLLKSIRARRFVERTLLYKMGYWTKLSLSPKWSYRHFFNSSFLRERFLFKKSIFQKWGFGKNENWGALSKDKKTLKRAFCRVASALQVDILIKVPTISFES